MTYTHFKSSPYKGTVACEGPDCPLCKAGDVAAKKVTVTILERKWTRKPRSKKKRIRKKWRKNMPKWTYSEPKYLTLPASEIPLLSSLQF